MFRKGIVTFFDQSSSKGYIELTIDQQQIAFKLEDFSNTFVLPQIGERVKCVVFEQHGEILAKFIVRLDHKNFISEEIIQPALEDDDLREERGQRYSRKMIKKRRVVSENHFSESSIVLDENTLIQPKSAIVKDTDIDIGESAILGLSSVGEFKQVQPIELPIEQRGYHQEAFTHDPVSVTTKLSMLNEEKNIDDIQEMSHRIDEIKSSEILKDFSQLEVFQKVESNKNNRSKDLEAVSIKDQKDVFSLHCENDKNDFTVASDSSIKINDLKQIAIVNAVDTKKLKNSVQPVVGHLNPNQSNLYVWSSNEQVQNSNEIGLNFFHKKIQKIKVNLFYSKRKQQKIKKITEQKRALNPWIVISIAIVIFGINFIFYAIDRYKQYQSNNLVKLKQYEHVQKEENKRQKNQAHKK